MPSPLRNRLRAIGTSAAPKQVQRPAGLIVRTQRRDLPPELLSLSPVGLRRIGWTGGPFDIRRCLFLDTETTGLSCGAGTVAFLIGVGWVEETPRPHMVIEQYLLRDYSDEPEQLLRLADRMDAFDSICTFNGRSFDMQLLKARFTLNRLTHRWREPDHLDLLYPSRRTWKLRLGSCRLCRLEEEILHIPRSGDIPGSEVPQRFFQYLKSGDLSLLEDIIDHNRQDIATLALLLQRLVDIHAVPEGLTERKDIFSVGRSMEKLGELGVARELYRISAIPAPAGSLEAFTGDRIAGMANWHSYLLARKNRDTHEMRRLLECMHRRRQLPFAVLTELSKLAEHTDRNYAQALAYAEQARALCPEKHRDALEKRIARLHKKHTDTGGN